MLFSSFLCSLKPFLRRGRKKNTHAEDHSPIQHVVIVFRWYLGCGSVKPQPWHVFMSCPYSCMVNFEMHQFHHLPIGSVYGIDANIGDILMGSMLPYSSTMDPMGYCWSGIAQQLWRITGFKFWQNTHHCWYGLGVSVSIALLETK